MRRIFSLSSIAIRIKLAVGDPLSMNSTPPSLAARIARAALATLAAAAFSHDQVVNPLPLGRFQVACSNIEQDTARIAALGAPASAFWESQIVDDQPRYITEILPPNSSALRFNAPVPDLRELYPVHAGEAVEFVAIVCHPTSQTNPAPDYKLPETG